MGGIQAQLATTALTFVSVGAPILFNAVLNDQSLAISYNPVTGQFTVTTPGNYYVAWWIATDGASTSPEINFAITLNGIPISTGSTPIVTGQLSGEALVTVGAVPSTISLINTSADMVALASTVPVQANIVIVQIS